MEDIQENLLCKKYLEGNCPYTEETCRQGSHRYEVSRMPSCCCKLKNRMCHMLPYCIYRHHPGKECFYYKIGFCPNGPICPFKHNKVNKTSPVTRNIIHPALQSSFDQNIGERRSPIPYSTPQDIAPSSSQNSFSSTMQPIYQQQQNQLPHNIIQPLPQFYPPYIQKQQEGFFPPSPHHQQSLQYGKNLTPSPHQYQHLHYAHNIPPFPHQQQQFQDGHSVPKSPHQKQEFQLGYNVPPPSPQHQKQIQYSHNLVSSTHHQQQLQYGRNLPPSPHQQHQYVHNIPPSLQLPKQNQYGHNVPSSRHHQQQFQHDHNMSPSPHHHQQFKRRDNLRPSPHHPQHVQNIEILRRSPGTNIEKQGLTRQLQEAQLVSQGQNLDNAKLQAAPTKKEPHSQTQLFQQQKEFLFDMNEFPDLTTTELDKKFPKRRLAWVKTASSSTIFISNGNCRYFRFNCIDDVLRKAVQRGMWGVSVENEPILRRAYQGSDHVFLFFSNRRTSCYNGFAKMTSNFEVGTQKWPIVEQGGYVSIRDNFRIRWFKLGEKPFREPLTYPSNNNESLSRSKDGEEMEPHAAETLANQLLACEDSIMAEIARQHGTMMSESHMREFSFENQ